MGRSIPVAIILTIVTCGIYGIYWFIVLTDEVNTVSGNQNDTSGGICFLLSLVTCGIYTYYWAYKIGEKLDQTKNARNVPSSNSGVIYLILSIFGLSIVAYALAQSEVNKLTGFNG